MIFGKFLKVFKNAGFVSALHLTAIISSFSYNFKDFLRISGILEVKVSL